MPDGHFDPLPEGFSGPGLVRSGKFVDVEVLGTIVASGGVYDNITITNATIDNATITNADIDELAYSKIVAGTNPNTLTHSGTFNVSGDLNVTGSLDLGGDLTMGTGGVIAFASAAPRLIIDYDTYGSQDIVFESGHQYEYSKGKWNFTSADSTPFIYSTLALTGTYLGDATNRGSGNINVTSDYYNSDGEVDINSLGYGTWHAITSVGASTAGSGNATTTISASSTSGTGVLSLRSSGEVNFYSGGAERLVLNSSGQLQSIDGDQTGPAYSFAADTNSGMYNLGSDDVGIVAGGARRLRVNATRIDVDNVSFFSLPVKATTGDPTGQQEGDMYVNTSDNALRLYADSAWRSVLTW